MRKDELDRTKTNRGDIFKTFMEPRNRFKKLIPPAYVLACLYNSPIPGRFQLPQIALKLLKRLQIRAQATLDSGIGSLESIPGLLKRLQIQAQTTLASGIGSLESIPGLSLSPHLETFKEPRNQFQGIRDACNNRDT